MAYSKAQRALEAIVPINVQIVQKFEDRKKSFRNLQDQGLDIAALLVTLDEIITLHAGIVNKMLEAEGAHLKAQGTLEATADIARLQMTRDMVLIQMWLQI